MPKVNEINSYLGNPRLKKEGTVHEYSPKTIQEYIKCREDILYFAEKYFYIVHIDHGKIKIPLYDFQKKALLQIQDNRFNIFCQSRQTGKTTTLTIAILHFILFNKDKRVALLGNKAAQSREILARIKMAYEMLPQWLQQNVKTWNKGSIELENGSSVIAAATTTSSIRGESIAFLLVDETAFIENWDEFYKSTYPTIVSGTQSKVVLVSTPNGMNHFYKLWTDASKGKSQFKPFQVKWYELPGRDEKWKQETISNTSETDFLQEQELTFLGGSNTLISVAVLQTLVFMDAIENQLDIEDLLIFELPHPSHVYVLVADTSRGTGNDYSAFSVIDVYEYPFKQVATYRNNTISYLIYPTIIEKVAKYYNNAYVLVENNDIGGAVASELNYQLEYNNLINSSNISHDLGIRTTKSLKRIGCQNLKGLIEQHKLIVNDFNVIEEFSTFAQKIDGSYSAQSGHNDDLVMGLVIFAWFTGEELFEDITKPEFALRKNLFIEQKTSIEDMMLPPPIIIDHTEPTVVYHVEDNEIWNLPMTE